MQDSLLSNDMSSKEEILQSKGGGGLLYICLEKFNGKVRALICLHKKPCFPKDMSSKKEIYAEQGWWCILVYLLGEV